MFVIGKNFQKVCREKRYASAKVLYKAGIYTRLSSERKEEWREKSSSIETQVLCCKEYALKRKYQNCSNLCRLRI